VCHRPVVWRASETNQTDDCRLANKILLLCGLFTCTYRLIGPLSVDIFSVGLQTLPTNRTAKSVRQKFLSADTQNTSADYRFRPMQLTCRSKHTIVEWHALIDILLSADKILSADKLDRFVSAICRPTNRHSEHAVILRLQLTTMIRFRYGSRRFLRQRKLKGVVCLPTSELRDDVVFLM